MAASGKAKAFEARLKEDGATDGTGFMLSQPFKPSNVRCKRRFVDLVRLQLDLLNTGVTRGPGAIMTKHESNLLLRERYLLLSQCIDSKPGQEPQNPYLYDRYA